MNRFNWLVRREVWETRAIWIAPAICLGIMVLSAMFGGVHLGAMSEGPPSMDAAKAAKVAMVIVVAVSVPFFITMAFTAFFYTLDSLYGDRRDRSVLFWKSLPISDADTVLSKLAVASLVIPVTALVAAVVGQLIVAGVIAVKFGGVLATTLWSGQTWLVGLVAVLWVTIVSILWYLPLVGWLLLASAWAPRSPFLWAVGPPLAVALAERVAFGTTAVWDLIASRSFGLFEIAFKGMLDGGSPSPDADIQLSKLQFALTPGEFFTNPQVWLGVIAAAALVAGAIWVRRYRDESI
jgi:ABC-2 type transport system permease protein